MGVLNLVHEILHSFGADHDNAGAASTMISSMETYMWANVIFLLATRKG